MKKKHVIIGSIVIVTAIVVTVLGALIRNPGRLAPQPLAFNHRLHLERIQGVECRDCHQFVASEVYAGLPSKFVCFDCHSPDADDGDTDADAFKPQFASLMAFAKSEGDIPWHRVTAMPHEVFFSHRRHVTAGKIDCRQCHPKIPDRTSPLAYGPVQMSMETCITCHEQHQAGTDCICCHR